MFPFIDYLQGLRPIIQVETYYFFEPKNVPHTRGFLKKEKRNDLCVCGCGFKFKKCPNKKIA